MVTSYIACLKHIYILGSKYSQKNFRGDKGSAKAENSFHRKINMGMHVIIFVLVYVIAWVAVKFGINTTSVVLELGKISRGKAE